MQIMGSGMPSAQAAFNLFAAALTCLLPLYFMQEVSPLCQAVLLPWHLHLLRFRMLLSPAFHRAGCIARKTFCANAPQPCSQAGCKAQCRKKSMCMQAVPVQKFWSIAGGGAFLVLLTSSMLAALNAHVHCRMVAEPHDYLILAEVKLAAVLLSAFFFLGTALSTAIPCAIQ